MKCYISQILSKNRTHLSAKLNDIRTDLSQSVLEIATDRPYRHCLVLYIIYCILKYKSSRFNILYYLISTLYLIWRFFLIPMNLQSGN